jgi:isocitrate dehydrogenase
MSATLSGVWEKEAEAAGSVIKIPVTVAHGDGIGPEIMRATLRVLEAAGAPLEYNEIEMGEAVYKSGLTAGIPESAWESIEKTRVLLKAPITTPQGGGYKSLNVTLRKTLGLYANVRPAVSYAPYVRTHHPKMDVVIVRENEEDLYAGIEHQQTDDVMQCLKLVSRPGCERVVRYAFEYARQNKRKKITCMTKDNIMKKTDGLFHRVFDEIGAEYPEIEKEHLIIDIGAARMADTPEMFDVVVTMNLYGDILSDIAAQVAGSVGIAPSANIGERAAMFEAIHGSAPQIAGQGVANPSGLLLSAVMMLVHVRQNGTAEKIHNAWLRTIEDGIHTADLYDERFSQVKVGTEAFADAVIERLGQEPLHFKPVRYEEHAPLMSNGAQPQERKTTASAQKTLVGVDVFVHWKSGSADELAALIRKSESAELPLTMITNRGVKVWPHGHSETFCTDHWRCRFHAEDDHEVSPRAVLELLGRMDASGVGFIKTENLYLFDGKQGYSLGQGQ